MIYPHGWILGVMSIKDKPLDHSGFVLPYVLIVIFILALAGSITALRLQNTTNILVSMQASERTSRMMDSAENVAIFALMSGNAVQEGYDLNPQSLIQSEFGLINSSGIPVDQRVANQIVPDIWEAFGGLRKVQTQEGYVVLSLQDVSGLASLNNPSHVSFDAILKLIGGSTRETNQLRQRLADYIDLDDQRRPLGAEERDYKLRDMKPPSNSPLRSYAELSSVLGWSEVLNRVDLREIKERTTLQANVNYRPIFAKGPESRELGFNETSLLSNNFDPLTDGVAALSKVPTGHMRLTLWAQRQIGLWDKRIIEISRQAGHISAPYTRQSVLEVTILEEQLEFNVQEMNEIKNVIETTSFRP